MRPAGCFSVEVAPGRSPPAIKVRVDRKLLSFDASLEYILNIFVAAVGLSKGRILWVVYSPCHLLSHSASITVNWPIFARYSRC